MQGEEGIGGVAVDHELDLPLSRDGRCIAEVCAPPAGGGRAQGLGGGRVVQLEALAEGVELAGRVLNCRVICCTSLGPVEAQIAEVDASKVSESAVLWEQKGPCYLCHCRRVERQHELQSADGSVGKGGANMQRQQCVSYSIMRMVLWGLLTVVVVAVAVVVVEEMWRELGNT